mgnify:CR=1 FL=1
MADGKARQFTFGLGVKSLITRPSAGLNMNGAGFYEISGLAWSGSGRIARVEVSLDGGASWREATLDSQPLPKAAVRFRLPWDWQGAPAVLASRATDSTGEVQPTRAALLAETGPFHVYHYNAIQLWQVQADGSVRNAY